MQHRQLNPKPAKWKVGCGCVGVLFALTLGIGACQSLIQQTPKPHTPTPTVTSPRATVPKATKTPTKPGKAKKIPAKPSSAPVNVTPGNGAIAKCNDGTFSYSLHHRGTCSHHHGVAIWYR